ncbi:hypothetical protein [Saccharopolyspora thermophila]|uniref:hypothetical protein n=1 Tax=Saccharopolyspora thermophila TaxID=89367 RepID=UPI0031F8827C
MINPTSAIRLPNPSATAAVVCSTPRPVANLTPGRGRADFVDPAGHEVADVEDESGRLGGHPVQQRPGAVPGAAEPVVVQTLHQQADAALGGEVAERRGDVVADARQTAEVDPGQSEALDRPQRLGERAVAERDGRASQFGRLTVQRDTPSCWNCRAANAADESTVNNQLLISTGMD